MSEQLLFMADNLFDPVQYPAHTISGQEEATNHEAFYLASGRRHASSYWTPTTANSARYVTVTCNAVRGVDTCIIDRNSNLISNARLGNTSTVSLSGSSDGFTSTRSLFSITLPTVPGGLLSGAYGAVTDEDVWGKTVDPDVAPAFRLTVAAMGSGVLPQIGGLWLGKAWVPTSTTLRLPYEDEVTVMGGAESDAPSGWRGRARPSVVREGSLHIRQTNENDYDAMRYQLGLFAKGRPAWLAFRKDENPWRMMLVECPRSAMAWLYDNTQWLHSRVMDVPFRETQSQP